MIPKSIRWRLPLSYAAIALLVALALGVVLLTTLRGYYQQRELAYLTSNAHAISSTITDLVTADVPAAALQAQLRSLSFLSQTRVRLLDRDGAVLADSGDLAEPQMIALPFNVRLEQEVLVRSSPELTATFESPAPPALLEGRGEENSYRSFIIIEDAGLEAGTKALFRTETMTVTANSHASLDRPDWIRGGLAGQPDLIATLPIVGTPYGFWLNGEIAASDRRSDQVVSQPFYNAEGNLRGYVELSQGPAYGRQILDNVARGWAVASGVAVLLAVGSGWFISRRLSLPVLALADATAHMAGGNLSARADVTRQDELGLLAHSFNDMADRVEETVVALRRFVADAAHELHTPLTALRTNLELAASEKSEHHRLTFIERAQVEAARLEALTNGLLDLSRIESGTSEGQRLPLDLVSLVQAASESYASQAEQAGLSFTLDLPGEAVVVQGDAGQLRRALSNFLDNAIKFTPEGGAVRAGIGHQEGHVELWVEDNGIGIPPDDLPQLFSRFHRGRNATAYPGSGLGLTIVKAIAEGHGGQVWAENTSQGAHFSLLLPAASQR